MRFIALAFLTACSATPQGLTMPVPLPAASSTAASAEPTPSAAAVVPAPVNAPAAFGAITAKRTVPGQRQQIGTDGFDPKTQNPGTATGRYVTVDGLEYAIHWDDAQRFDALKAGDTVNLHPTRDRMCIDDDCRRFFHVYPGNRFVPPLELAP